MAFSVNCIHLVQIVHAPCVSCRALIGITSRFPTERISQSAEAYAPLGLLVFRFLLVTVAVVSA